MAVTYRLALFASGTGSNARVLIDYFAEHPQISVALVVSNNPTAPVLAMAQERGVAVRVVSRSEFYETQTLLAELRDRQIDGVVLAGFLWLVPPYLVQAFPRRMVNIHPALLPKYGGRGMYGEHVHAAVRAAGDTETGISIHLVNEQYDDGDLLLQVRCPVLPTDTPADIARRVQALEHRYFAPAVEQLLLTN